MVKVWKDIANMGPHLQNIEEIIKKGTQFLIGNEGRVSFLEEIWIGEAEQEQCFEGYIKS